MNFFQPWKKPCVLIYEAEVEYVSSIPAQISPLVFHSPPLNQLRVIVHQDFVNLTENEIPQAGDIVAIDSEYVALDKGKVYKWL